MKLRSDSNEITPKFGSSLLIAISSNGLALSVCEPDPSLITSDDSENSSTIGPMEFFYDWHLNADRGELVGVSISFF